MENKTVTAAIRDKLVMDCVGKIAEITGDEDNSQDVEKSATKRDLTPAQKKAAREKKIKNNA